MQQALNVTSAGNRAVAFVEFVEAEQRRQQLAFIVGAVHAMESRTTSPSSVEAQFSTAAPAPSVEIGDAISLTVDWDCIALYETGSDWAAHGSSYSSALGVMNQAVRENASEETAARILSGTASRDEQIGMAQGIVNRFGIDAWAPSTVEHCT